MSNLWFNLRQACRSLLSAPGFTLTALLTLALGIGATTAMFAVIYGAMLKPLPFKHPDRLVKMQTAYRGGPGIFPVSTPDYVDCRTQIQSLDGCSALLWGAEKVTATGKHGPESVRATFAADDLFQTLGLKPMAGRWFMPEEGRPGGPEVLVVSHGYAQRRFGSGAEAVGKHLLLMGKSHTIIGVVADAIDVLLETDVWAPIRLGEGMAASPRKYHFWQVVGRLKPGVTLRQAQIEVDALFRQLAQQYPDSNMGVGMGVTPLQAALVQGQKPILMFLMGAVGLVLLIACANVAGLLLARGTLRRTELAIRAAIGASRGQIVTQLLTESVVLSVLSGLAGLLLAKVLIKVLPLISGLYGQGQPTPTLDGTMLAFALALSVVTGILFGLLPALRASFENLARDLSPSCRKTGGRSSVRLRSALMIGQVGLSMVLLVGSSLLIRSFLRQASSPLGFDPRQLLVGEVELPVTRYPDAARANQFLDDLKQDLEGLPGVSAVSYCSHLPILQNYNDIAAWAADAPAAPVSERETSFCRAIFPDYFRTMGIPILAGRDYTHADLQGKAQVMIISQHMARALFPGRNAIGQRVMLDRAEGPAACEVVGIVGDVAIGRFGDRPQRTMYLPSRISGGQRFILRTTGSPEAVLPEVRSLVASRDPDLMIDSLGVLEQQLAKTMAPQKVTTTTLMLFSLVALMLAALGLYGVLSYLVRQRTREIGIRTALGAQLNQVVLEIMRQGLLLTAIGMGLGVLGSLAIGRLLASQLYEVSPADPVSMALGSLTLGVIAMLASLLPALQAARVNPTEALRNE